MMRDTIILRVVAKLLLPAILIFALYVQFHGDYGPGGGFQAGVAAAGAIILYGIIFGIPAAQHVIPKSVVQIMIPLGVLIFAGTGVAGLLLGENYLNYSPLGSYPAAGQHLGILIVEAGVFITVASTMLAIFYGFGGLADEADAEQAREGQE
jgi:multicomponent Na+:H+ antiporter subunit B